MKTITNEMIEDVQSKLTKVTRRLSDMVQISSFPVDSKSIFIKEWGSCTSIFSININRTGIFKLEDVLYSEIQNAIIGIEGELAKGKGKAMLTYSPKSKPAVYNNANGSYFKLDDYHRGISYGLHIYDRIEDGVYQTTELELSVETYLI